jgi:tetratricopeptide (TPR) repeat protein
MKKALFSATLILLALVFAAYGMRDKQLMVEKPAPEVIDQMTPSAATEIGLAEELAATRLAYHKQLEKIQSFYEQSGNQMKLEWVQRELKSLDSIPRYRYVLQAEVAGEKLMARDSIPKADILYKEALDIYNHTDIIFPIPLYVKHDDLAVSHPTMFVSKKKLQRALNKFNDLIKDYPTSNKIGDAAYYAGTIHEYFGDYSIAILYYKRAVQWNPNLQHPACYRAARLLDYKMSERSQAMQLYREALDKETEYDINPDAIRERLAEIAPEPNSMDIK